MNRRVFCTRVTGAAVGIAAISQALPSLGQVVGAATGDVALVYELQAAFHRAKTSQNLELMLSLWEHDAVLQIVGDPKSPYAGRERLQEFWASSGSFKNRRFSLVPSFKTRINLSGDQGTLYFECHDVGDYEQSTRSIVLDTFLSGTIRKSEGKWRFSQMTAGPSTPLSFDHYYA